MGAINQYLLASYALQVRPEGSLELRSLVRSDAGWWSVPASNILMEPGGESVAGLVLEGSHFYPFGHGIDCHNCVDLPIGPRWSEVGDQIDAPLVEGLGGFLCWV